MANNNYLYGFRYAYTRVGASSAPQVERAYVASAYQASVLPGPVNCDISVGDPVIKVSDGSVALWVSGASLPIFGIVANVLPFFDAVEQVMRPGKQLPGGTTYGTNQLRASVVEIIPAANNVFAICCDDAVTATTQAAYKAFIGENCQAVYIPNSTLKRATPVLDISTHAVTATLPWRIVDISKNELQDFTGLNVELLVTANLVQQAPWTALGV